jgi:DNA (cytosine-5)-methyltransferase 1
MTMSIALPEAASSLHLAGTPDLQVPWADLTMTDMFCGAGGSSTGAVMIPGIRVKTAMNHWQKALDSHNANHPDTLHIQADIKETDPRYIGRSDILWASPECFTAGHLVTTKRGQVPIEDVIVGDVVLTHKNRWRPVARTQHKTADTVIVTGQGHTGIEVTPNHRFWTKTSKLEWQNDIRQYRRKYQPADWQPVSDALGTESLWGTPVEIMPTVIPFILPPAAFGDDLTKAWWLIGRWVGDGSLAFGRNAEVTISCGFHEADALAPIFAETGMNWVPDIKRTAVNWRSGNREARDWLALHFNHGAAEKQIPSWALGMPTNLRRALLIGYLSADGGFTQRRVRASTVSRKLAVSVRMLAEGVGHRVSMAHDKRTTYNIEGRQGGAKLQWILHWEPELNSARSPESFDEDGQAWSRIRKISPGRTGVTVYNIEVDEDHSYVIDGITVANCTNHSVAKGRKRVTNQPDLFGDTLPDEAADRSRATMWDVLRFAEVHKYRIVITENVVDAAKWVMFDAWLMGMKALGYEHKIQYLNSMHAQHGGLPAPQSRDRMYVLFWLKGNKAPDTDKYFRPRAYCSSCDDIVDAMQVFKKSEPWGRYRAQYVYRCPKTSCRNAVVEPGWLPASDAIDWSLRGERIGDRDKPLAAKTMARIEAGLRKFGRQSLHLEAAGNQYDSADPKAGGDYYRIWPATDPLRTLHTTMSKGLVLDSVRGSNIISPTDDPFATQTTAYTRSLLVPGRDGKQAQDVREAMRTQTTRDETGLLMSYYGNGGMKSVMQPIDTLSTRDRFAMVTAMRGTSAQHVAASNKPVTDPFRTFAAEGTHQGITEWSVPNVEECEFRMLEPHEIKRGMAFPDEYIMIGNKREQVKMAGNAVTPPAARDLVACMAETLGSAA